MPRAKQGLSTTVDMANEAKRENEASEKATIVSQLQLLVAPAASGPGAIRKSPAGAMDSVRRPVLTEDAKNILLITEDRHHEPARNVNTGTLDPPNLACNANIAGQLPWTRDGTSLAPMSTSACGLDQNCESLRGSAEWRWNSSDSVETPSRAQPGPLPSGSQQHSLFGPTVVSRQLFRDLSPNARRRPPSTPPNGCHNSSNACTARSGSRSLVSLENTPRKTQDLLSRAPVPQPPPPMVGCRSRTPTSPRSALGRSAPNRFLTSGSDVLAGEHVAGSATPLRPLRSRQTQREQLPQCPGCRQPHPRGSAGVETIQLILLGRVFSQPLDHLSCPDCFTVLKTALAWLIQHASHDTPSLSRLQQAGPPQREETQRLLREPMVLTNICLAGGQFACWL